MSEYIGPFLMVLGLILGAFCIVQVGVAVVETRDCLREIRDLLKGDFKDE